MKRSFSQLLLVVMILTFITGCATMQSRWEVTKSADTIQAYEKFLRQYPKGDLADQARGRLNQLYEQRDWKDATQRNTAKSYEDFLHKHPNAELSKEDRRRIAQMLPLTLVVVPRFEPNKWALLVKASKDSPSSGSLIVKAEPAHKSKEYLLPSSGQVEVDLQDIEALGPRVCFEGTVGAERAQFWLTVLKKNQLPKVTFIVGGQVTDLPDWLRLGVNYPNLRADRLYTIYPQTMTGLGRVDIFAGLPQVQYSLFRDAIVYWNGSGYFVERASRMWVIVKEQ